MPKAKPEPSKRRKSPRCRACGAPIRVPKDWNTGAAVRRHYWAKHRSVMESKGGRR